MNSITSRDLLNLFIKNIFIIFLSAVIFGAGAFIYCEKFTQEKYAAQGEILVTNGGIVSSELSENKVANTDVAASINLLPTIRSTLASSGIYKEFADYLKETRNINYPYSYLMAAASVDQSDDQSLFLSITFELNSKKEAIGVTNEFLKFAPGYIENKIEGCRAEADPQCDTAVKTAPHTFSTTVIATVCGAILCFAVVFLISLFNLSIKSDEDFSTRYNIPVIGNIPDFSVSHNNKSTSKGSKGGK